MRTLDFTPLLRSAVGFDDLFGLAETLTRPNGGETGYPPYDIERINDQDDETGYRITMALAGFSEDELEITVKDDTLLIEAKAGKAGKDGGDTARTFLHRGIARRAFSRRFRLAETIRVTGARFENGLLDIDLVREIPEHAKPRRIAIGSGAARLKRAKAA